MSRLIGKKGLVLFLFPLIEHMFWILLELPEAILTNIQNICFFVFFLSIKYDILA